MKPRNQNQHNFFFDKVKHNFLNLKNLKIKTIFNKTKTEK